jgi:hypothetical protein
MIEIIVGGVLPGPDIGIRIRGVTREIHHRTGRRGIGRIRIPVIRDERDTQRVGIEISCRNGTRQIANTVPICIFTRTVIPEVPGIVFIISSLNGIGKRFSRP